MAVVGRIGAAEFLLEIDDVALLDRVAGREVVVVRQLLLRDVEVTGDTGEVVLPLGKDVEETVALVDLSDAGGGGLSRGRFLVLHRGLLANRSAWLLGSVVGIVTLQITVHEQVELIVLDDLDELIGVASVGGVAGTLQPLCPTLIVGHVYTEE